MSVEFGLAWGDGRSDIRQLGPENVNTYELGPNTVIVWERENGKPFFLYDYLRTDAPPEFIAVTVDRRASTRRFASTEVLAEIDISGVEWGTVDPPILVRKGELCRSTEITVSFDFSGNHIFRAVVKVPTTELTRVKWTKLYG